VTRVIPAPSLPGPTLHVLDLDGLVVRSDRAGLRRHRRGVGSFHHALVRAYASAAGLRAEDHAVLLRLDAFIEDDVLILTAPYRWLGEFSSPRLTPVDCLMCYERVVVGSGSARLAPFVRALSSVDLPVTVVHRPGLLSPVLARAADTLVPLRRIHRGRADSGAVMSRWIGELRRS
jgi:hypothetical protein